MSKILLVDDDPDIRDSLAAMLASEFEVVTAEDGGHALQILQDNEKPDVILMDVKMKTPQEGFELVRALSHDEKFNDIPVLILTSTEAMTASEATAEIVRQTREKYGVNTMNVLVIKTMSGDVIVDYKSQEDGSTVSIHVAGYHAKPVNAARLIRELKGITSETRPAGSPNTAERPS